jgi:hypothetical protein
MRSIISALACSPCISYVRMVKGMHAAENVGKFFFGPFGDVAVCHVRNFTRGTLPRVTKR